MLNDKIKNLSLKKKRIILSIIALLEAIMIICTATFSWVEVNENAKVDSYEYCKVSPGAGLIFRNLEGNVMQELTLPNITLSDCSSVDGRNFFFPTSSSFKNTTDDFIFRAGTAADVNAKYIRKDFYIETYTASNIYISESTSFQIKTKSENTDSNILKALRVSLNFNDGTQPIVFCPALNKSDYKRNFQPISSISNTGEAITTNEVITAVAFNDYYSNTKNSISEIPGGTTKRVTFSMWLEGTDLNENETKDDFWENEIDISDLSIQFTLSTTEEPVQKIYFYDYSPNNWIKNDDVHLFAIDKSTLNSTNASDIKTYKMGRLDNITYVADVPKAVKDIAFARFNPDDQDTNYNVWASSSSINKGSSNTYYAIGQGEKQDGANIGYWVNSSCSGVIDVYFTDSYNIFTGTNFTPNIYFQSDTYNDAITTLNTKFIPSNDYSHDDNYGLNMKHCGYNGDSKIYRLIIPADAKNLVFNSGATEEKYSISNLNDSFSINLNGYNKVGFWYESSDNKGTWIPQ